MAVPMLAAVLLVSGVSCRRGDRAQDNSDAPQQEIDDRFVLDNVNFEQANDEGETVWTVSASRATYSPDRQTAEIDNPQGELYQDGEPIFRVGGDRGVIRQDGERIILSGNISATDLRNGAVLEGGELIWVPEDDILTIREDLKLTHPDMNFEAGRAQFFGRDQRVELEQTVRAEAIDPQILMTGERLVWDIEEQQVVSDGAIEIQRFWGEGEEREITDQATAQRAEFKIDEQLLTLEDTVRIAVRSPVVTLATDALVWDIGNQIMTANSPLEANLRDGEVNLRGNRGRMDLGRQLFDLTGNVRATTSRNQSELEGDRLIWNNANQRIEVLGNVFYSQTNPTMYSQAPRLTGTLRNQVFVMDGGRVVTEFIPENDI